MPVHEVFVHHFRLPRRGEEMAHFLFCYAFADNKTQPAKLPFAGCTSLSGSVVANQCAHWCRGNPVDTSWSPCRGRCRAQLFATKERYRCGLPLAGTHRPAFLRPHSFLLSLSRKRKEPPRRQKKPAPFRFRRGRRKLHIRWLLLPFPKADRFAGSPFGRYWKRKKIFKTRSASRAAIM